MPDVSDRHTDTQLAALGLAMLGIEHPRTNHGELELTDAALHTEQQAIVRTTRVIHALHVDYSRLDQTTKLEQMMPVSTVARQPRSIQAQHRADISSTDGSDEPIEAGSAHRAARGASKIVVNYFNVDEAALVQIQRGPLSDRIADSIESCSSYAARTARQISDAVAMALLSLP